MRKIHASFLEEILKVETNETLKENPLNEIFILIKEFRFSDILGNEDLYNKCYDILNAKLPFVKKYIIFWKEDRDLYIEINEEDVLIIARLLNSLEIKIKETEDIYSLLPILLTYNFLGIDYRNIIKKESMDELFLLKIKDEIYNILLSFQINTSPKTTIYNEKRLLELYINGTVKNNIDSIYEFINAVERGIGFNSPFFLDELVRFLYCADIEKYINVLNNKKQVIEMIFLLNAIYTNEKLNLISYSSLDNKWSIYELFRQIIIENKKSELSEIQLKYLCNALIKIATYDISFFRKILIEYKNDKNFNIILGKSLIEMDKEYLDVFLNTISVEKYNFNLENNQVFLINLIQDQNEEKVKYICQHIYKKWTNLLDDFVENNQFLNEILYSDYYYCVLHYLILEYDEEKYFTELDEVLKYIEEMIMVWKSSSTNDFTYFFVGVTKLYTLSLIFNEKKFAWEQHNELKSIIEDHLYNRIYWLRFYERLDLPEVNAAILDNFDINLENK